MVCVCLMGVPQGGGVCVFVCCWVGSLVGGGRGRNGWGERKPQLDLSVSVAGGFSTACVCVCACASENVGLCHY